ncbi:6-phospho-alpha-glucosidase [Vibrio sp. WXL103]|uniref:6-phospho-alpha-glucosidase n=1 Tax=Vibrio sp. WXL103 TaxID=3450710 RepID=UPI003EC5E1BD
MKKSQVIAIAGGGSTYTAGIVKALLARGEEFPVSEIRMYDTDEQRQSDVAILVKHVIETVSPTVNLIVTCNPEVAFSHADFVFAQIRVGQYKMRVQDEQIPLRHGCVGQETCGPGGLAYGMRTIFPMIELIDFMQRYAKETCWMLNYSNPASIVAEAVNRLRPKARVLNICDMPIAIQRNLAEILSVDRYDLDIEYFGLNHLGWFSSVRVAGEEKLPQLRDHIKQYGMLTKDQSQSQCHADSSWIKTFTNTKTMMSYFPDFIPNTYLQYYLLSDDIVEHSDPDYTRANQVMEGREKGMFDAINKLKSVNNNGEGSYHVGVHGEFIVDVAMSIAYDLRQKWLVIIPNNGLIQGLPDDAMVEVPALLGCDKVYPLQVGKVPNFHLGIMHQQLMSEKCLVDAAIEGSYEKALQAFTLNRTVPSSNVAKIILDEMIEANFGYWPTLN